VSWAPAGVRGHDGFLKSYASSAAAAWNLVRSSLAKCGAGCRLVITGHSLGGALAQLAASQMAGRIGVPIDVYSFSNPRVFSPEGAQWFHNLIASGSISSAFRFVNNRGQ
jgi:alpha-beta hydrolase superfamily lysophospholipase